MHSTKKAGDCMTKTEIRRRLLSDVLRLRTSEGYLNAGYPKFDGTLFGRDSLISALQMLNIDPRIAKSTLDILAYYQSTTVDPKADAEPGKILHNKREKSFGGKIYFGSVDATPLFIIVAEEYFKKTGDRVFLLKIWDNIIAAVNWMSVYGDADRDHFLEYERKHQEGGLFHQGWRDSVMPDDHLNISPPVAIVEAQGYAYAAYRAAANLASQLGKDSSLSNSWLGESKELREAFHKSFWQEEKCYYHLALDGNKAPKKSVSSNPGHLLFTGIIQEEILPRVVDRLFQPDLHTLYGIRTTSEKDSDFDALSYHLGSIWPHDNWVIYYGLKQLGFIDEANRIKEGLVSAYKELGHIPELFAVVDGGIVSLSGPTIGAKRSPYTNQIVYANNTQAWASCGLLNMLWDDV